MSKYLEEAPYEVASDPRTERRGDTLFLDGKLYACPEFTSQEVLETVNRIQELLDPPRRTIRQRLSDWLRKARLAK